LAAGYRIARWLDWGERWLDNVRYLPIRKVRFCEFSIVAGSVMTLSRGPWIAASIAALMVTVCKARNRRRAFWLVGAGLVLASVPLYYATMSYVSVRRAWSTTQLQQSAAYRYELIERYVSLVQQRPTWGWGRGQIPQVDDLSSIDNQYLLLALTYGIFATALLLVIFLWMTIRLFARGIRLPRDDPAALLMFTLLGVHVVFAISITMSWLGAQTGQFLFLVAGWSEGVLLARPVDSTLQ
jgi:O-antigen ligase